MAAQSAAAAGSGVVRTLLAKAVQAGVATLLLIASLAPVLVAQKAGAQSAPTQEASAIVRAESAMDRQQWSEADAILRRLVAADARNAKAWFDLGYVMHAEQNYAEAILAYRGAVAAQPDSFECNLNLGLVLAHENQAEASKYLEMATHLKPTSEDPQAGLARAWAALAQEQDIRSPKNALDSWQQAVAHAPDNFLHRVGLGQALERSGDATGAETEFRKAIELQPNSTDALASLSNLLMRANRLQEAEEPLRRLVNLAPQDRNGHLQLGRVLSAEKKDAEAAAELQKALALRADDWDALRELAFVQERGKEYAAAENNYRTLLTRFSNDPELYNGLGSVLLSQLKYAEAQNKFMVCVRMKPDWGEAYGQLALAAAGNKDYGLAIKSLDERKKLLAETPSSYFLRATCYDHLRRFAEAEDNYKAFLAASHGQYPDDEWKARHRLMAIEPEARGKK
jgi:tetratricopeptide (TPR) repeat protein